MRRRPEQGPPPPGFGKDSKAERYAKVLGMLFLATTGAACAHTTRGSERLRFEEGIVSVERFESISESPLVKELQAKRGGEAGVFHENDDDEQKKIGAYYAELQTVRTEDGDVTVPWVLTVKGEGAGEQASEKAVDAVVTQVIAGVQDHSRTPLYVSTRATTGIPERYVRVNRVDKSLNPDDEVVTGRDGRPALELFPYTQPADENDDSVTPSIRLFVEKGEEDIASSAADQLGVERLKMWLYKLQGLGVVEGGVFTGAMHGSEVTVYDKRYSGWRVVYRINLGGTRSEFVSGEIDVDTDNPEKLDAAFDALVAKCAKRSLELASGKDMKDVEGKIVQVAYDVGDHAWMQSKTELRKQLDDLMRKIEALPGVASGHLKIGDRSNPFGKYRQMTVELTLVAESGRRFRKTFALTPGTPDFPLLVVYDPAHEKRVTRAKAGDAAAKKEVEDLQFSRDKQVVDALVRHVEEIIAELGPLVAREKK